MKRVYLDVCTLCRPYDDQSQIRIRLEADAMQLILAHIRLGKIEMIVSDVHILEIKDIKELDERDQLTLLVKELGKKYPSDVKELRQRANSLVTQKFGIGDAAHIAFAEAAKADFVSVDDRLLKQCRKFSLPIWYGSPLAYCDKENLK